MGYQIPRCWKFKNVICPVTIIKLLNYFLRQTMLADWLASTDVLKLQKPWQDPFFGRGYCAAAKPTDKTRKIISNIFDELAKATNYCIRLLYSSFRPHDDGTLILIVTELRLRWTERNPCFTSSWNYIVIGYIILKQKPCYCHPILLPFLYSINTVHSIVDWSRYCYLLSVLWNLINIIK